MIQETPYHRCEACGSPEFIILPTYNIQYGKPSELTGKNKYTCANCGHPQSSRELKLTE
ncbi:hypothetical protein [Kurthia sp. Dielmo]|uniref:hypothetical protein n=1 Tax=Kurthia sp. Dielmo TaxID=1033738 RepID=UPI0016456EC5|nr:hypothetical protein [Kurthia sp. Dielmo]